MSNLIDIASSSILAYRTALSVTGENIANVNTEGYRARTTVMAQNAGAQATATTMPTGGQGVQVVDIRRAFDGLVAERARQTAGAATAAETHLTTATAIENLLIPGSGGIDTTLDSFFTAVSTLASQPADSALRQVVLDAGQTLASTVSDIAGGLGRLREDTATQASTAADRGTALLKSLAELQGQIGALAGQSEAANPLMDQRDALLNQLGDLVGITTTLDTAGRAKVTLGSAGGPVLLDGTTAATLTTVASDRLTLKITRNGTTQESRLLAGGTLGGLSQALGMIDDAVDELDGFARHLTDDMNAAHAAGLNQQGQPGGAMFGLTGWRSAAAPTNRGSVELGITLTDTGTASAALASPITLTRDAAAGVWQATDANGQALGSGDTSLSLPGMVVDLSGQPRDGDRLTLTSVSGHAIDMRFLLTTAGQIAAAAATLVAPAPGNLGNATAQIVPMPLAAPALPGLAAALASGGTGAAAATGADAVTLLQPGVVGYVPAGTQSLDLASFGSQATLDFTLSPAQTQGAQSLTFGLDGTGYSFDLTTLADGSPRPANWTAADLAQALDAGQILSQSGESLKSLGLMASGNAAGQLGLARGQGNFDAGAQISGSGGVAAALTSDAAPQGGTIQIFTRSGRQVAGTPMTAAEAAALLTPANGFLTGARYDAATLNGAGGTAYRGMGLDQTVLPGLQAVTLNPPGGPAVWSGSPAAPATAASTVTLDSPGRLPLDVAIPAGASAATAAKALSLAVPGLAAQGVTALRLDAPADGKLSFQLEGANLNPVTISADVVNGRLDGLAQALNAASGATGVRAELSPDGAHLLMVQDAGETITLTHATHSAAAPLTLQQTDAQGQALGFAPVVLGAGADSARITGQVLFSAEQSFGVSKGGVRLGSAADPAQGGLIAHGSSAAGAVQSLTISYDPALDGAAASADGTTAQAGASRYSVTLGGRSVSVDPAAVGAQDASGVAAALAHALRADTPVPSITGGALANLPADGSSLALTMDGQSYVLRMQAGAPVIEGPEPGRLTASFGPGNRLTITAPDGSTDGRGIGLATVGAGATAFGLGAANAPTARITGQPVDPASLPAGGTELRISLGGTTHLLHVAAQSGAVVVTPPAGFPGQVSVDATTGAITLDSPLSAGAMQVDANPLAGYQGLGASLAANGTQLTLTASDGNALPVEATATGLAGQRLHLDNLPPEDLIVVMTGSGNLRLGGSVTAGTTPPAAAAVELRVTDAKTGAVELLDSATGHSIASGLLDANHSAVLAGYAVTLSGDAATNDRFTLSLTGSGSGNGQAAEAMAALRVGDPATQRGGFAEMLTNIQSEVGSRTAAAKQRLTTANTLNESAQRAQASIGAVDLDAEASRLVGLQQAYQGSAQVLSVARDLFDTLLKSL